MKLQDLCMRTAGGTKNGSVCRSANSRRDISTIRRKEIDWGTVEGISGNLGSWNAEGFTINWSSTTDTFEVGTGTNSLTWGGIELPTAVLISVSGSISASDIVDTRNNINNSGIIQRG